ncbi:hypothetical protein ABGB12_16175 [Actinocorallia sp. B10E7]|uniref:hypothetical protein n=1 Tax=Actinocorallia sp. B10E7 TaxID=3153558 RepID=UPI00325D5FF3
MKALCGAATALTCVGAVVSLATASSAAAGPDPRTFGPSFVYDDDYSKVLTAVTVRTTRRSTSVTLDASNFPPSAYGRSFGAHVHVDRCGAKPTDSGKHYQHSRKGKLRDRELWLDFTVDRNGHAHVRSERPWAIKAGAANSVVVHGKPTHPTSGEAGDPIICTTVPFHGSSDHAKVPGYKVKSSKDMSKDVRKDIKQVPLEKYDARADKQASPGPRAEEHHAHGRHDHHARDHKGRHLDHEGRHHEHDDRDHEYRDHEYRDHDGRDHDHEYDDREYHGTRFHGYPVYRVPVYRNHSDRDDERVQPQSYGH